MVSNAEFSARRETFKKNLGSVHSGKAASCLPKPQIPAELNLQVGSLKYKQSLASDIVSALRSCSNAPEVQALAYKIRLCNDSTNLVVASDLHNSDGEAFNGKTTLAACNSRFCQNCAGRLGRANREKMRKAFREMKLFVGEFWFMPTFTIPNNAFVGMSPGEIKDFIDEAWQTFTHCETRPDKSKTWYQRHFRGGFKNAEFTFNENYHFHLHALMIGSAKIQRSDVRELRQHWTNAVEKTFAKFGKPFECKTSDGLLVVNLQKVRSNSLRGAINEMCKYLTVSKSWLEIPKHHLEAFALMPSFGRMFESFGDVRRFFRDDSKPKEKTIQTGETHILDTMNLKSDQNPETEDSKQETWRTLAKKLPLPDLLRLIRVKFRAVQAFRRRQLKEKFPAATFWTLDNDCFGSQV